MYAATANGDAPPIAIISGGRTHFGDPREVDVSGRFYVADGRHKILVFSAGSNGDVAPAQLILGDETGLRAPLFLAIR